MSGRVLVTGGLGFIGSAFVRALAADGRRVLNVDLDTAPFTSWITACGLEDATFTSLARETGEPVTVPGVRPHAAAALADVFGLRLEELPGDEPGLWAQPLHARL